MSAADQAPKKRGRPPKADEDRLRDGKITVQMPPKLRDELANLVAEASRIRGEEVSLSSACVLLIDAGMSAMSAKVIAAKAHRARRKKVTP